MSLQQLIPHRFKKKHALFFIIGAVIKHFLYYCTLIDKNMFLLRRKGLVFIRYKKKIYFMHTLKIGHQNQKISISF